MFKDRNEAGKLLAQKIRKLKLKNVVVLGLARGGVAVAWQIAKILKAPLNVIVFRKLGAPQNPELAIGAVGSLGKPFLEKGLIFNLKVPSDYLNNEIKKQKSIAKSRETLYHQNRTKMILKNKNVILVDDGIATGSTILAAIMSILKSKPKTITVAVPVAPPSALEKIKKLVTRTVVLKTEENFGAVGQFYKKFGQVEDNEVIKFLSKETL